MKLRDQAMMQHGNQHEAAAEEDQTYPQEGDGGEAEQGERSDHRRDGQAR